MQAALSFVAPVLVCLMAGIWLDRHFGTSPLFLFIGLFLGFGTGLYSVYRTVMEQSEPGSQAAGSEGSASGARGSKAEDRPGGSQDSRSGRDDAR